MRNSRTPKKAAGALALAALACGLGARGADPDSGSRPGVPGINELRELVGRIRPGRPRLLMGPEDAARLAGLVEEDPALREVAQAVLRDADAMLGEPPAERIQTGRRLLGQSRRVVRRLLTLSMAFHLTGREDYAQRAALEMRAAAGFSDWNPSHFLDTAEMTFAMAIGYDWLYPRLDGETREAARRAILEKGLRARHAAPDWWRRARNNWGQVCHAGMMAGALATLEDDPDETARILHDALINLPRPMSAYSPRGSYPEGPGYWSYGTSFNVLALAMLESVLGHSFGLEEATGFDRTGGYPALMTGPSGLYFNYADGSAARGCEPAVYWLAARFGQPGWATAEEPHRQRAARLPADGTSARNRLFPLLLLWMRDAGEPRSPEPPLHWSSGGTVPVTVHRSAWADPRAVYAGFKAGSPSGPHGRMDAGSFVLDAGGVRWAMHLPAENYHRIESRGMGFWDRSQGSDRWRVFRQSNLGHNTLVIDGALQVAEGHAPIVFFSDDPAFPCSVADLSPVYAGQAGSVFRGIALLPEGGVLIRDRLTGLNPGSRVRWGMLTAQRPGEPGGAALRLRHDSGAEFVLRILRPAGSVWALHDTATPAREWDSPNPGTVGTAFGAVAPASGVLDLAVWLAPDGREPATDARPPPPEWNAIFPP